MHRPTQEQTRRAQPQDTGHPASPAAVVRLARETARRFREAWDALPDGAVRRWGVTMAVGAVVAAGLMLALVQIGKALEASGALAWETGFLRSLEGTFLTLKYAIWVEIVGNSLVVLPLLFFAAWWAAWHGRPLRALGLLVGLPLYKLTIGLGWWTWKRERPGDIAGGLDLWQGWSSYPSGHIVQTLFVYGLLVVFWMQTSRSRVEQAFALLLLALLTAMSAFGRMRAGAHWPSDMLAGFVIGTVWVAVVLIAVRRGR